MTGLRRSPMNEFYLSMSQSSREILVSENFSRIPIKLGRPQVLPENRSFTYRQLLTLSQSAAQDQT
jgi:hypothetical protein